MKQLFILRHAKSSWADPGQRDFDRPLNARGRSAAPVMGAHMARQAYRPDYVLCSPAARTRETLERIQPYLDPPAPTAYAETLYLATAKQLLSEIAGLGDRHAAALVIGHNPGLEDLCARLADPLAGDAAALVAIGEKFPTAGLAVFTFPANSWREISPHTGALVEFATPKGLAGRASA
ncbi:MAG: histidine phosphatase family protein [Alphaproteobacteria bacterium]|nr:histidine phosphatase family protein [Alphaproteobacteria bacterium]